MKYDSEITSSAVTNFFKKIDYYDDSICRLKIIQTSSSALSEGIFAWIKRVNQSCCDRFNVLYLVIFY